MKYSFVDEKVVNKINASRNRKLDIFRDSEPAQKGFLLLALPKQTAHKIINDLDNREIVDIIGTLDPNKSTRLLHELSSTRARHIIEKLKTKRKSTYYSASALRPQLGLWALTILSPHRVCISAIYPSI